MKTEEQVREMIWENRALLELCRSEANEANGMEEKDLQLICGILAIVLEEEKAVIPVMPPTVKLLARQMRADFENKKKAARSQLLIKSRLLAA